MFLEVFIRQLEKISYTTESNSTAVVLPEAFLPIIPKVIFKHQFNLDNITEYEKQFCIFPSDLFKIIENAKKDNLFQPNEALKFAKILYYYGCHPIAYDDNKVKWSVSK